MQLSRQKALTAHRLLALFAAAQANGLNDGGGSRAALG
jgi:hypothetical protein